MSETDPGSFRDPASRIIHEGNRVIRLLDERGLRGWEALSRTSFFERAVDDARLISSKEIEPPSGSAGALEHPRLPFVSYPYEWTFGMLKDAALLQLDLLAAALAEGLTIKDSSPFNIQFLEGRPIFIDIGSFQAYEAGEPWIGYRQFTRQFLFPLMMRAWGGIPFQPWLRGDMEGPTAGQVRRLLPWSKRVRPTTMLHVSLQARMEERMVGRAVRAELKQAGFNAELIQANVRKLRRLVAGLEWERTESTWSGYRFCEHVARDREAKADFLRGVLDRAAPRRVLDLGANDGHFSRIAASQGAHAIAVDGDDVVLDQLYREAVGESISVVVTDLGNPSPSQGWAGAERPALAERARAETVIAYGLIHHLIYTMSIPPAAVARWLRDFDCPVALEFVAPEDEMVQRLIANKLTAELHPGRTEVEFGEIVGALFFVGEELSLEGGTRRLLELLPRY